MKKATNAIFWVLVIVILVLFTFYAIRENNYVPNTNIIKNEYERKLEIPKDKLNLFYFYVGQADSIFITLNNMHMLIDTGDDTDGYHIANFLKAQGIDKLDYLIGTHIDDDHIGGMDTILNQLYVDNLYISNYTGDDNEAYNEVLDAIPYNQNKEIKIINLKYGDIIDFGDAKFNVIHNSSIEDESKINNTSLVLSLEYGEKKYLFTGDIEKKIESKLMKDEKIKSMLKEIDILKIPHHASNSSSSSDFLEVTSPEYVIISSGSNHNNFPNIECLYNILQEVVPENIFMTERDGTIWVTSTGTSTDDIKCLNKVNLDGAGSEINPYSLGKNYLESIIQNYL